MSFNFVILENFKIKVLQKKLFIILRTKKKNKLFFVKRENKKLNTNTYHTFRACLEEYPSNWIWWNWV